MYESLNQNTHLAPSVIFGLALLYLVAGMVSPSLARASGSGVAILRSTLAMMIADGLAIGVIVYTHMQPDGPHALDTYIKNYEPGGEAQLAP